MNFVPCFSFLSFQIKIFVSFDAIPFVDRILSELEKNCFLFICQVRMPLLDQSETFSSLAENVGLDLRLRKAVQRLGHIRPTLVQSKCLPLAMTSGRDLLVRAKTGSVSRSAAIAMFPFFSNFSP